MLKGVCVAFGFVVALNGASVAGAECTGPWSPPSENISPAVRTQDFHHLLDCAKQGVAEARTLLGRLAGLKIDDLTNALADDNERLSALLQSRTTDLNKANADIAALVGERTRLNKLIDDGNKVLANAKAGLADAQRKISALANELGTVGSARDRLNTELAAKAAELDKASAGIADLTRERDKLTADLATRTDDFEGANNAIAALGRERDNLKDALAQASAALDAANTKIAALHDEIDRLNVTTGAKATDLDKAQDRIGFLDKEHDRLAAQIDTLTASLKIANDKITYLEKLRDKQKAEIDDLNGKLDAANERIADLEKTRDTLTEEVATLTGSLQVANDKIDYLKRTVADRDDQIAALNKQLDAANTRIGDLETQRDNLREQIATLSASLKIANDKIAYFKKRDDTHQGEVDALDAELKSADDTIASLEKQREQLRDALNLIIDKVRELRKERDDLKSQVAGLEKELADAKDKIADLEKKNKDLTTANTDLTDKLNKANATIVSLPEKIDSLANERSRFFTELSKVLDDKYGVEIVGDRFVFPSTVLFASGSADLNAEGIADIGKIAEVVKMFGGEIPSDIHWVLQVNGHTDKQPILPGGKFKSNWELSTARALAVVELLIADGVAPEHLAAAGFGEFQPLKTGDTPEDYAANRRIELKLTDDGPEDPMVVSGL